MTKRPFRLTRPEPKESQVLRAVLHALSVHPAVGQVWRVNSGAGKLMRKNGESQWIRFGFAGLPDIAGYLKGGKAIFCEVKRPSGKESEEQKTFIDAARKAGCVAFVARRVEDVFEELNKEVA